MLAARSSPVERVFVDSHSKTDLNSEQKLLMYKFYCKRYLEMVKFELAKEFQIYIQFLQALTDYKNKL